MFDDVKQPEFLTEEVTLRHDHFYCCHCIDTSPWDSKFGGWTGEYGVRVHVETMHGVERDECERGTDFFRGEEFGDLLAEWRRSHESIVERFTRELRTIGGGDDAAFECGDDPPFGLLELS